MGAFIDAENLKVEMGTNEEEGSFYINLLPYNETGEERSKIIVGAPSFRDEVKRAGKGFQMTTSTNEFCDKKQNKIEIRVELPDAALQQSIFTEMQKTITTWLKFWTEIPALTRV